MLIAVVHNSVERAVIRAAMEALVAPFVEAPHLIVRDATTDPSPSRLFEILAETPEAQAAVTIACEDPTCTGMVVNVTRSDGQFSMRALKFRPKDALAERGRGAGLIASTLLPENWSRRGEEPSLPVVEASLPPALGQVVDAHWAAQATAAFFVPTRAYFADIGFQMSLRRRIGIAWQAGAMLRAEQGWLNGSYSGDFSGIGGGPSVAWCSTGLNNARGFGFGARIELLAIFRRLRHDEPEGVEYHDHWAIGGQTALLVGYSLSSSTKILAAGGFEYLAVAFIDEEDARPARLLPARRLVTEVGIAMQF